MWGTSESVEWQQAAAGLCAKLALQLDGDWIGFGFVTEMALFCVGGHLGPSQGSVDEVDGEGAGDDDDEHDDDVSVEIL